MTSFAAPAAPSVGRVLGDWHADGLLLLVVAAAALYLLGVSRLAGHGRAWPRGRTVAFLSGLAVIAVATASGLDDYGRVLFSLHVVQHVLLGMVAPLLLALGAPVTLALQALGRTNQRRLLRALRAPPVAVVAHPLTAWLLFGGALVVLYFTGLLEASLRHHWVHALVHVHFVAAGCLFLARVVGVDPVPHALGFGARVLYVLVALPFHAFLGVAILSSDRVLAGGWYEHVVRRWGTTALADQRTGAGILWLAGELFGVVTTLVVVWRWMAADERAAARHDRRLSLVPTSGPGRATTGPGASEGTV